VTQLVDFVEVTLDVTGSGYEGQTHDYDITIKNVASEPDYILLSCDYEVKFIVGIDEESLIAGNHNDPLLYVGEEQSYIGTFAPSLVGVGNIEVSMTNAAWGRDASIVWTTNVINPWGPTNPLTVSNPVLTGASKTYEDGNVAFTLTELSNSAHWIDFTVKVYDGATLIQTIAEVFNAEMTHDVPIPFDYDFVCTSGGSLTMEIEITNALPE